MTSSVSTSPSRSPSPSPSPRKARQRASSVDSVFNKGVRESEPRGRSRLRRERSFSSGARGSSSPSARNDITASATATLRKGTAHSSNRARLQIDRVDNTLPSSAVRPYYIVEWNGKKYRLTHTQKGSNGESRHVGYIPEDWEKMASQMIEIWDALKQSSPNFAFASGNLSVGEGIWKQRSESGKPTETFTPATPSLDKVKNLLPKLTPHTMNYERTPPKLKTPEEDLRQPPKSQPVIEPLHEEPPPEALPWYSRWAKTIRSFIPF
jgi:hypothetical protein